MRKNIQRIMSIMLVLFLLIPSLAIAETSIDIDYTQRNNNAIIKIKGTRNRPISITIKDESRYHYMNQGVTDDLGKIEFTATLDVDNTYECKVNIDGKTTTKKIVMEKADVDPDPEVPVDPTDPEKPKDARVDLYIKGYKGVIVDEKNIKIRNKETALGLTTRILDDNGISYENNKGYIVSIDGQGEFDKGEDSGWMFSVNGKYPDVGAGSVRLKDGDKIKWLYTKDLGEDIGAPSYKRRSDEEEASKIIKDALKIVEDKNATEKEIRKAIEDVVKYFEKNSSTSKTSEIKSLLRDGARAVEVLTTALDRIKDAGLATDIGNGAIDIVKSLNSLVDSKSDKEIVEKLSEVSEDHLGIALNSIDKIKDKKKIDTIIDNILEISIKVEEKLSKRFENPNRDIEKNVRIKMTESKDNISEIILPKSLLEKATSKKVDNIKLFSTQALIEIKPDFLGKDIDNDIKIISEKKNKETLVRLSQGNKDIDILKAPIKITLPYDVNYTNKHNITVTLVKEDGTKEIIGGVYDETNKNIKFLTHKLGRFTIGENRVEFKDLSNHGWAVEAINSMAAKGIIGGKAKDKFDPAANITRAEFSALISRMLKYNEDIDNELPFKDVNKGKWYYKSISTVYKNRLINGKSDISFDPDGYITREEMSKIIGQVLENKLYKNQNTKYLSKFTDRNSISTWAQEGASISAYNKIISGYNGQFSPKQNATRAETAVMLYRLYELTID